jgi:hypothetical protein
LNDFKRSIDFVVISELRFIERPGMRYRLLCLGILFLCLLIAGQALAVEASWRVTADGVEENGIKALSGSDGVTTFIDKGGSRGLTTIDHRPPMPFIYFDLEDSVARQAKGPIYLVVDYFDGAVAGQLQAQYDANGASAFDRYTPAEQSAGGLLVGTNSWKTAIFQLKKPRFGNGQNVNADFRIAGGQPVIRSVRLTSTRPANWDQVGQIDLQSLRPLVKIAPGGELILGGFDPTSAADADRQVAALARAMPAFKKFGVTSHEVYVRWNLCEPQEGKFDWSIYDKYVALYKRAGIKWVPFLIAGSAYSLPDWYYKKPGSQGYVCLEHGQESDVQSLWNPTLRKHVERFIAAFCEHYKNTGTIESILLGITGNYGEAIYPVTGNDWTASVHGKYHTHPDFWAGDPFAIKSLQSAMAKKFGTIDKLNASWGTSYKSFEEVKPFEKKDSPSDRARIDFVDWYIDSMTQWARFWMQTTRNHFDGEIYLCTGGDAQPFHGSDFGEQCKIAASVHGGVRITNEGSDYPYNFALTRWVASAGRQYGAYFSFEPASIVSPVPGVMVRIYNATASGAKGLHYYWPNLTQSEAASEQFIKWGPMFQQRQPVTEIAVLYPSTWIKLHGQKFLPLAAKLRDRFDFSFMSEQMIRDGGLKNVHALILLQGNIAERDVWQAIATWEQSGGQVLYADGLGKLKTVEGDAAPLKPSTADTFHGEANTTPYEEFVCQRLLVNPFLAPVTREMIQSDGKSDGVFVTATKDGLLWLNPTDDQVQSGITLPRDSIVEQPLSR